MRYSAPTRSRLWVFLLGVLLYILAPLLVAQSVPVPVLVTGHFAGGNGVPVGGIQLRFQLQNCAGGVPRVFGTQTILNTQFQLTTDSTGYATGAVWPNDIINCGGITDQSRWTVQQVYENVPRSQPICYHILAATTVNLDTATPCPQYSPATPPGVARDGTFQNLTVLGQLVLPNGVAGLTTHNVFYADTYPGSDILAKAQNALTACALTFYDRPDGTALTSGCEIHIPRTLTGEPYRNVTTTLTLAGTANATTKLVFDGGASIEYTGSDYAIRATYGPTVIEGATIYGNSTTALGGIWSGEFAKLAMYNYQLRFFTKTGAMALNINGSDDPIFINGEVSTNYIGVGTTIGISQGYPMNAGQFFGLHISGSIKHQFDGTYLGAGNLIEGLTCDPANPSADEGCILVGASGNKNTFRNVYAEGQLTNGAYAIRILGGLKTTIDGMFTPYSAPNTALIYDGGNATVLRDIENGGVQPYIIDLSPSPFAKPDVESVACGGEPLFGQNSNNYAPYSRNTSYCSFTGSVVRGNWGIDLYDRGIRIPYLVTEGRAILGGSIVVEDSNGASHNTFTGTCSSGQQPNYINGLAVDGTCH